MSFITAYTNPNQTPTSDSKNVLAKSFVIDVSGTLSPNSGFTTATTYNLGWLPKDAQVLDTKVYIPTAVSGGTVSAATLAIAVAGQNLVNGANVFGTGATSAGSGGYYGSSGFLAASTDQLITYTPTLTGAGATAGVIYINILYVV